MSGIGHADRGQRPSTSETGRLSGAQLVISNAHPGLKAAITSVLLGAARQRCRVHLHIPHAVCSVQDRARQRMNSLQAPHRDYGERPQPVMFRNCLACWLFG
jgi:hypothetical protein